VPVGEDTFAYRRSLPHLAKNGKTYFITVRTADHLVLSPAARDIVLKSCLHDHRRLCWLHCVVVMPDHVHLLITPFGNTTLQALMRRMKGASGHEVNRLLGCHGAVWQRESFDHILRGDESLMKKAEYIARNPIRAGLVDRSRDYKWWWRPE